MSSPALSRRAEWCAWAVRLGEPVLAHLAAGDLRASLPTEAHQPETRRPYTQLEAVARTLAGLAPWLENDSAPPSETAARHRLAALARAGLARAADPSSTEAFNFTEGTQPLVDAAFLAEAFLRAPRTLWQALDATTRARLLDGFRATRAIPPYENNWHLFAALIEVFLHTQGEPMNEPRLLAALEKHEAWYKGDGAWGDGLDFHWDYYNSFVIQPMLVDIFAVLGREPRWRDYAARVETRTARYAAVQERLIAADGTFPPLGRSLAYRAGAFQSLAQSALRERLPADLPPARARVALTRALRRTLDASHTFTPEGWLRIGLSGHQPSLAEHYISTASCYLCSVALLPLGLPADADFWSAPDLPTTADLAWSGHDLPADAALK